MHSIELHKRAQKALRSIPADRARQIVAAIGELVYLDNPVNHPNVRLMEGDWSGSARMRVGSYRVIFELVGEISASCPIRVTHIGPRGDIYG
jgi:mRNA-degrading endonuclease RelE of RelBE toxin-antitoxin system